MLKALSAAAITALAPAAMLAAPASADAKPRLKGEAKLAKMLEGYEPGEPVRCINLNRSGHLKAIDRTALVYDAGSTIYVNRSANPQHIDDDDVLETRLYSRQLCSVDTVTTRDRSLHFQNGFIALEEFVPYHRIDRD